MVDSKPPLVKIPAPNDIRTGLYYSISSTHDPTPKLWDVATSGWHHSGFGSEGGIKLWDVRTGKLLRAFGEQSRDSIPHGIVTKA
jgi:hypothetical protein